MKLVKFRRIEFNRIGEDEFIVQLFDKDDNIVMTFDPHTVEEGDNYSLKFGNDLVTARENMPVGWPPDFDFKPF